MEALAHELLVARRAEAVAKREHQANTLGQTGVTDRNAVFFGRFKRRQNFPRLQIGFREVRFRRASLLGIFDKVHTVGELSRGDRFGTERARFALRSRLI